MDLAERCVIRLVFIKAEVRRFTAIHRKKSFTIFPSSAGMSVTKLSLGGKYDVIYKLFPPSDSLVIDRSRLGTGISKLFLRCIYHPPSYDSHYKVLCHLVMFGN
jgi:hypothetical protein